ncbi:ATP-binding protein [uncultured Chryseobacterium sp.]|nr:ATP-binding protein [uncultured Chryseobacterium sp.]
MQLFGKEHWFYRQNILHLEEQGKGEPFLSGKLCVSEEFLAKVLKNKNYKPDYSTDFPAKLITTPLDWNDLIVTPSLMTELENISGWLCHAQEIRSRWNLDKYIKPGYRCLFYGPPGTGKTLTASLLGKQHGMDVYRIDVSLITAACTAETEKNIARIFDFAEQKNWILFFDKADKLMEMNSEYALQNRWEINQEIRSYLLQRIEDFPGMIIMAITHPKDNPVKAFSTNFQSVLYFPMPDQDTRLSLWKQMIPDDWLQENREELLRTAAEAEISGGCIVNVIRRCALALYKTGEKQLTSDILLQALSIENQSSAFNSEKSSSKLSDQTP